MRVALVIYGSLDQLSGGYLYDRRLVDYLRRENVAVEIISLPPQTYLANVADNFSEELFRRLRKLEIDILLQDELNHPSLFYLNRRLRGAVRYRIISIVHHLRCYETHPPPLKFLYRQIERAYLASVDGFICNSQTTRAAVRDVLKQTALPNAVVAFPAGNRFHATLTVEQIVARAHRPGALKIIFVGNLIPRKGLHYLLDALAHLPQTLWQLAVVGGLSSDAKYVEAIRAQIAQHHFSNVHLLGAIDGAKLAALLAEHHVLVVPSQYEGFGIVYLEAMSFGLPAIATRNGAACEIITEGKTGFLVPLNAPATLARRIATLERDRAQLAQMSLAARARFLSHPTWDESMERVQAFLQKFAR